MDSNIYAVLIASALGAAGWGASRYLGLPGKVEELSKQLNHVVERVDKIYDHLIERE